MFVRLLIKLKDVYGAMAKVLIAFSSLSGNTQEFAELIKTALEKDNQVDLQWLEHQGFPDVLTVKSYDYVFIGTYTWGKGQVPEIQRDFAYHLMYKPENVIVFGTGESQFGQQNYCNAAKKLHEYYESKFPLGICEQAPRGYQIDNVLKWAKQINQMIKGGKHNDIYIS